MSRLIDADALMEELNKEVKLADDWKTAHEIANVVKYFPTIEVNKGGDLISRQAALALAKDIVVPSKDGTVYRHRCIDPQQIMDLPTVDIDISKYSDKLYKSAYERGKAEGRKMGEWIKLYTNNYKCSVCGDWCGSDDNDMVEDFKYCPNCGARMVSE